MLQPIRECIGYQDHLVLPQRYDPKPSSKNTWIDMFWERHLCFFLFDLQTCNKCITELHPFASLENDLWRLTFKIGMKSSQNSSSRFSLNNVWHVKEPFFLAYKLIRASVVQSYTRMQLWKMTNEYRTFKMDSWTNTCTFPNVSKKFQHIMALINSIISFGYANVT